jgi:hypothetical protein
MENACRTPSRMFGFLIACPGLSHQLRFSPITLTSVAYGLIFLG